MSIEAYSKERDIKSLLHFTRWENIDGIIQDGLCPKYLHEDLDYEVHFNDENRWDGYLDSVSLSISFPNDGMFYKYRMNTKTKGWVILVVHPSVLWEYEIAFCKHNAASYEISTKSLEDLKTLASFKSMFDSDEVMEKKYQKLIELNTTSDVSEVESYFFKEENRLINRLKNFDPTDPQAEVLSFDIIPPEKFIGVIFEDSNLEDLFNSRYPNVKTIINKNYFHKRCRVRRECWRSQIKCLCNQRKYG